MNHPRQRSKPYPRGDTKNPKLGHPPAWYVPKKKPIRNWPERLFLLGVDASISSFIKNSPDPMNLLIGTRTHAALVMESGAIFG
jgi:hypothetical protein